MGVDLNDLKIDRQVTPAGQRRFPFWILGLLLILGGGAVTAIFIYQGRGGASEGIEVETVNVTIRKGSAGPAPRSFTAGGWVEPAFPWPVVVSALTAERVESLKVQEGDRLEKGGLVAVLYDLDLKDQARRAAAETDVAKAKLSLLEAGYRPEEIAEAKAKLKELEAESELKGKIAARSLKLCETQAVSCEQAEKDEAAFATARARVEAQEARVALLEAGPRPEELDEAKAEVRRRESIRDLAEKKLTYTQVRSPRAGTVYRLLVEQGERLSPAKPFVLSLYDPLSLWVRIDVAQADISKVSIGQGVEIRTEAEPDRAFPGRVIRLDPRASFAKNTITVRVEILDTEGRLHPDMTARVHFHSGDGEEKKVGEVVEKDLMLIPRTAVLREKGASFVYELNQGVAKRRAVELGGTLGDSIEVLNGLSPNVRIIVTGLEKLADGAPVREKSR
ncbi:MAG: efflux RND transporter periplasmic adaptor subunit [Planctomycetota bacterium]|jgi:RND family efflux transporter MFP subunit